METETVIIAPGTGTIVRRTSPDQDPIVTGIPPVVVRGKKYSRRTIAKDTGINHSHVSKIFSGTRKPSLNNVIKLARYFGIPMEELLTGVLPRVEIRLKPIKPTDTEEE